MRHTGRGQHRSPGCCQLNEQTLFTCCHPALALEDRVALTLKTVAGLKRDEIARAYLLPVDTLQRRLNRAKQKLRESDIQYAIPADNQIAERLGSVLRVIYLIYNQAYTTLKGDDLYDGNLSKIAIYLARVLNRLIRDEPEVMGLLALLLLQHARAGARVDAQGLPVPLDQQDRSRWNGQLIAEANIMLEKCDRHWQPGPYQIQAAIAAVHCNAESADVTDWQEVVNLYDLLDHHAPSSVVSLNRAVAMARLLGPEKGLELLNQLAADKQMQGFQYYHSARAGLLEALGEYAVARRAFSEALALCQNDSERRYLQQKIDLLAN